MQSFIVLVAALAATCHARAIPTVAMRELNLDDPAKTVQDVVDLAGSSVVDSASHFVASVHETVDDTVVDTVNDADTLVSSTLGVDVLRREIHLEDPVKTVEDVADLVGSSVVTPAGHFVEAVSDNVVDALADTVNDADTLVSSMLGVDILRRALNLEDPAKTVEDVANLVGSSVVTPAGHFVESVSGTVVDTLADTIDDADTLVDSMLGVDVLRRALNLEDPEQTVTDVVNLASSSIVTPAGDFVEAVSHTAGGALKDTVDDADTLVDTALGVDIL